MEYLTSVTIGIGHSSLNLVKVGMMDAYFFTGMMKEQL